MDCGFITIEVTGVTTFIINDVDNLRNRTVEYPIILDKLNKMTPKIKDLLSILNLNYMKAREIVNTPGTSTEKVKKLKPILENSDHVSKLISELAGFWYSGGCGAGKEDSEAVTFLINPKPKNAMYILEIDYDKCVRVVKDDTFNVNKCDLWHPIQRNDYLSGQYRYRVIWDDGQIKDGKFSALGKSKKLIEISK